MKKVNEILTTENSFFETMLDEHGRLYDTLFNVGFEFQTENTEPKELDMMLSVNCGERYAAPLLVHHDMSDVVGYVVKKYGDNWLRVKDALLAEYDLLKPYSVDTVTTGNKNADNDTTSNSTDKTKIVGFDSAEGVDSNIDTNDNTVKVKQTEKSDSTVKTSGNNGNLPFASLITSEIEVRKNSFVAIVINDIQSQITLDIY